MPQFNYDIYYKSTEHFSIRMHEGSTCTNELCSITFFKLFSLISRRNWFLSVQLTGFIRTRYVSKSHSIIALSFDGILQAVYSSYRYQTYEIPKSWFNSVTKTIITLTTASKNAIFMSLCDFFTLYNFSSETFLWEIFHGFGMYSLPAHDH